MTLLAERFEHDGETTLAGVYRGLLASEARHHTTYVDLARSLSVCDEAALKARLAELAAHEAVVSVGEDDEPVRLHN